MGDAAAAQRGGGRGANVAAASAVRHVGELSPLRLRCRVGWPLSLIVDDAMLEQYNQVLVFLLQVCETRVCGSADLGLGIEYEFRVWERPHMVPASWERLEPLTSGWAAYKAKRERERNGKRLYWAI